MGGMVVKNTDYICSTVTLSAKKFTLTLLG
jgi:hypothetical protein